MAPRTTSITLDLDRLAPKTLDMERRGLALFGAEVRQRRIDLNISMRSLASEVDIQQPIISRVESGTWCPTEEEELTLRNWMSATLDV